MHNQRQNSLVFLWAEVIRIPELATFTRTSTTSSTIPHLKIIHSVQLHRDRNILWVHRKARILFVSVSSPENAQATLEVCSVFTSWSDLRSNDTNNTARHKHFLRNNCVAKFKEL